MVRDVWRTGLERRVLCRLAVEKAKRVLLQALLRIRAQLRLEGSVVGAEAFEVRGPAFAVADGVQLETKVAEAELAQPIPGQLDDLGVERGRGASDRFHVELKELSVATLLGPVIAKHRPDQIKTRGLRTLVQAALEVGPHNSGSRLGAQGQAAAAAVLESIKLLGECVCVFARTFDQLGLLQDVRHDLLLT